MKRGSVTNAGAWSRDSRAQHHTEQHDRSRSQLPALGTQSARCAFCMLHGRTAQTQQPSCLDPAPLKIIRHVKWARVRCFGQKSQAASLRGARQAAGREGREILRSDLAAPTPPKPASAGLGSFPAQSLGSWAGSAPPPAASPGPHTCG